MLKSYENAPKTIKVTQDDGTEVTYEKVRPRAELAYDDALKLMRYVQKIDKMLRKYEYAAAHIDMYPGRKVAFFREASFTKPDIAPCEIEF